ncbi:ketopantoate reductase family protein [Ruminococcaceae bacterium OttesenSCG-928-O06]|nr:ketopantoate reductase family protein [Ruminococcaceae bacterium OttesenSCG-928-O06]
MRIAIVGAGSMGTIIGAYMTKGGLDVEMIDANREHVEVMSTKGATVQHLEEDRTFTIPVKAYTPDKMNGIYDLVFLITKQTANPVVLPNLLKYLNDDSIVCTLQNGIPEPNVAEVIGEARTIGGAMLFPATWIAPGISAENAPYDRFKTVAGFDIGEVGRPATPRLEKVKEILDVVAHTTMMDNLMDVKWTKLCVNCCCSGLSAALSCTFGEAVENKKSRAIEAFVAKECLDVCHAEGYTMITTLNQNFEDLYWTDKAGMMRTMDALYNVFKGSMGIASMLQDMQKKQPSEVDYIPGHTEKYGKKHGIATPFNSRVAELIREAEARGGVNDMSYLSRFDDLLVGWEDTYS